MFPIPWQGQATSNWPPDRQEDERNLTDMVEEKKKTVLGQTRENTPHDERYFTGLENRSSEVSVAAEIRRDNSTV